MNCNIPFISELLLRNPLLFWFGCANIIAAFICIPLTLITKTKILGVNAWIKPLKFFLSIAIFTWTMAWYLQYLNDPSKTTAYTWAIILILAFENTYIAIKAAKGQLSHFNDSSTFNRTMFAIMGVAISILTAWTAYIGILFFTKDAPQLSPAYLWAIRLGILIFVIFAFQGAAMGGRMSHTVGATDGGPGIPILNWSKSHGDLRISHFLGMHALQILPLTAYFCIQTLSGILVFAIIYFLTTTLILSRALKGKPLFS